MSAQRFRSKIDGIFYFVFALGVGLPLVLALYEVREGRWLSLVTGGAIAVFLSAMAKTTYYVVDDQFLKVCCLIASKTIPLASITALRPTRNPLSAPALSLDRLEVTYQGERSGFALVSPDDKAGFIEAIRRAQPAVSVADSDWAPSRGGWTLAAMMIGPLTIVAVMLYASSRPPNVEVTPAALTVSGSFGVTVPMRNVTDVSLQDQMPRVVRKRMGTDGFALRGRFELEGMGDGMIYVRRSARPYVLIRTRDSYVCINYPDSARTQALFDEITRARTSVH